jgi:hypothetical protein
MQQQQHHIMIKLHITYIWSFLFLYKLKYYSQRNVLTRNIFIRAMFIWEIYIYIYFLTISFSSRKNSTMKRNHTLQDKKNPHYSRRKNPKSSCIIHYSIVIKRRYARALCLQKHIFQKIWNLRDHLHDWLAFIIEISSRLKTVV